MNSIYGNFRIKICQNDEEKQENKLNYESFYEVQWVEGVKYVRRRKIIATRMSEMYKFGEIDLHP